FWEFSNDWHCDNICVSNRTDEWMFGDQLLVAPILGEGQAHRSIYLPAGIWYDYFRGTRYDVKPTMESYGVMRYGAGANVTYAVNPNAWNDIPLFVRAGAIVPTQDVQQYVGEHPVTRVYLDVFPEASGSFTYYDDDGETY